MTFMNYEIPSLESLRAKYELKKDILSDNRRVRIRRGLSWTERAQKELDANDPDAAFIFQWVGFEALYSEQSLSPRRTKPERDAFLKIAVGLDMGKDALVYNGVVTRESKTILTLAANAYVFDLFWDYYYGRTNPPRWDPRDPTKWADYLIDSVQETLDNLKAGENRTFNTLIVLFDRLYVLRNQLAHGGSTWEERANRDQVGDGARIMSRLLPVFLDLAMDNPNHFSNAPVIYPPPDLDPNHIIGKHNDYVCRLAKFASEADSGYRNYLSEAVERELDGNPDCDFVARVREILYR